MGSRGFAAGLRLGGRLGGPGRRGRLLVLRGSALSSEKTLDVKLSDGFVELIPYREEDIDDLYQAARESITDVHPWLPWCHPKYRREESEKWVAESPAAWARGEAYNFVIRTVADGRFAGGCSVNDVRREHQFANVGYWVRPSMTGKGIATAAVELVARFAFERLSLTRLQIVVALGNGASLRVAEKAGARPEGVARNRLVLDGVPHDAVVFSLIPGDLGLRDSSSAKSSGNGAQR